MIKYEIKDLLDIFKGHVSIARKNHEDLKKRYLEENGKPYPHEDFLVTEALLSMCEAIDELQQKIK